MLNLQTSTNKRQVLYASSMEKEHREKAKAFRWKAGLDYAPDQTFLYSANKRTSMPSQHSALCYTYHRLTLKLCGLLRYTLHGGLLPLVLVHRILPEQCSLPVGLENWFRFINTRAGYSIWRHSSFALDIVVVQFTHRGI